jgi:heme/copper-type cytochrome/quinol oxidase subunit 2
MEVCGRYHHWMPILIRVVHVDAFCLWALSALRLVEGARGL